MTNSRAAIRYAKAIMQIAQEKKELDTVIEDFKTLSYAVEGSRDLRTFLSTPVIDERTKQKILGELLKGKVGEITGRFLDLLVRKGRAGEIEQIITAFRKLLDQQRNESPVTVTTAVELDADQKKKIEEYLRSLGTGTVRATYQVDSGLIGGFRAQFADRMIDASVRHQLERLRQTWVQGTETFQSRL